MRLIETVQKYVVDSEDAARGLIEEFREDATKKGYRIKKAGYEYKTKKSKGEILAEAWIVKVEQVHGDICEELE